MGTVATKSEDFKQAAPSHPCIMKQMRVVFLKKFSNHNIIPVARDENGPIIKRYVIMLTQQFLGFC